MLIERTKNMAAGLDIDVLINKTVMENLALMRHPGNFKSPEPIRCLIRFLAFQGIYKWQRTRLQVTNQG